MEKEIISTYSLQMKRNKEFMDTNVIPFRILIEILQLTKNNYNAT